MFRAFDHFLQSFSMSDQVFSSISYAFRTLFVALLCVILTVLARFLLPRILRFLAPKKLMPYLQIWNKRKLLKRIIFLITPLICILISPSFGSAGKWIVNVMTFFTIIIIVLIIDSILSIIDDMYRTREIAKKRPIKGFLQIFEIIIIIVFGTVIVASWIGESPIVLLSGIGAFTAILTLVFKDSILGFISGIQLTANDMIRIGDWIEMPKYDVNGIVSDITLISVKVDNFDNTTSTVPAYALVSDSFKNWRKMPIGGSRRLKRSIYIDMSSIVFCTEIMIDQFSKNPLLKEYIHSKIPKGKPLSYPQTQLTNIGVFRIYLEKYLMSIHAINSEMTLVVRQLQSEAKGMPLEIYAFTTETDFQKYENVQSDIFDHIYAIAPSFSIRIFQEPSGYDMKHRDD